MSQRSSSCDRVLRFWAQSYSFAASKVKDKVLISRKIEPEPHAAPASAATEGHHLTSHVTGPAKDAIYDAMPTLMAKPKTLNEIKRPTRVDAFSGAE